MTEPNPTPPAPAADKDAEKLQAEIDKWKALARKHEDQNKAARADLDKLKATGDATKSDMDKVMAKLEAAEKRAAEADRRALHGEVVAATGLSMAKVGRLKGETVEELMSDAEQVFDWKPKTDDGKPAGDGKPAEGAPPAAVPAADPQYGRPKEKLTPDPGAGIPPVVDDRTKILAAIPRL